MLELIFIFKVNVEDGHQTSSMSVITFFLLNAIACITLKSTKQKAYKNHASRNVTQ